MTESKLDFYANLLVQSDDCEEYQNDNDAETSSAAIGVMNSSYDLSARAGKLISEFWTTTKTMRESTALACSWLCQQQRSPTALLRDGGDSIMRTLLTAGGAFEWNECLGWYSRVQHMTDSLLLGRAADCKDIFAESTTDNLMLIEHVTIIALEATLQALKLWDLAECSLCHAAGDLLVLVALAARRLPGCDLLGVSEQVTATARLRLYEFILDLSTDDEDLNNAIRVDCESLEGATRLDRPLMESLEDIRKGIPFLLRLYAFDLTDPILMYFVRLLGAKGLEAPLVVGLRITRTSKFLDALRGAVSGVENNWALRHEDFVRAWRYAEIEISDSAVVEFKTIQRALELLTTWLTKELEIDSAWVNTHREKCRRTASELCCRILNTCARAHCANFNWEEPETIHRLTTLLARTWAVKFTISRSGPTLSPSCRSKDVDQMVEDEHVWLRLLISLARYLPREEPVSRIDARRKHARLTGRALVDDLLDQIICGAMRQATFGLPVFLESSFDDLSRAALCNQRRAAQRCYAAAPVSADASLPEYEEIYRSFEGAAVDYQVLKEAMLAVLRITREDSYCCKLLSYVNSELTCRVVLEVCVEELLRIVKGARESLLLWMNQQTVRAENEIAPAPTSVFGMEMRHAPSVVAILKMKSVLGTIELGLDTHPDFRPSAEVSHQIYQFLMELRRYQMEIGFFRKTERQSEVSPSRLRTATSLRLLEEQVVDLSIIAVAIVGDCWLPRCIRDLQKIQEEENDSLRASCFLCLACDWLEAKDESGRSASSVTSGEQDEDSVSRAPEYEDVSRAPEYEDETSSIGGGESCDVADDSDLSSLGDFLDLHFADDYRRRESSRGLAECQLRPDLYYFVKNTFWDDRMADV